MLAGVGAVREPVSQWGISVAPVSEETGEIVVKVRPLAPVRPEAVDLGSLEAGHEPRRLTRVLLRRFGVLVDLEVTDAEPAPGEHLLDRRAAGDWILSVGTASDLVPAHDVRHDVVRGNEVEIRVQPLLSLIHI